MVDTVKVVLLFNELSDSDYQECSFPFEIGQRMTEAGEILSRYYEWESVVSPLTGAKCRVRAKSADVNQPGRVAGYEMDVNVPACINGRNHLLVNGVPRAVECAVQLLRHHAAHRGCSALGLEQIQQARIHLASVTCTFLFEFDTHALAQEHQQELRSYAEGVLNHGQPPSYLRDKSHRSACYSVGSDHCYTLYIKQREFKVSSYIKEPDVDGAFATFPTPVRIPRQRDR